MRNLGRKVTVLYLLVETKLSAKSAFIRGLLRVITRSPVSTTSLSQGHFHFFRLRGPGVFRLGLEGTPGKDALPWKASSDQPRGWPAWLRETVEGPRPAGGAAEWAKGRPLSCECIAKRWLAGGGAESRRSSSSKNGSIAFDVGG